MPNVLKIRIWAGYEKTCKKSLPETEDKTW